jgi:outer membrane autotransporter protein
MVSVGTAANRFNIAVTGGNGSLAGNGIRAESNGDVNVVTGNATIASTSTSGASWGIRARNLANGSGPGGAVIVDAQGAVTSGAGGIQAISTGTDASDSVSVVTSGPVSGAAGAGIQVRSVNGNASLMVSGPVTGSTGAGSNGIDAAISGVGNLTITTLGGGTVTATNNTVGILASAAGGSVSLNIGASVTSTGGSAVRTINTSATGTNAINIGNVVINGQGTSSTSAVIDMISATGGLTSLNTVAGTSIFSNSATTDAQNADLAIRGTGGTVVINHNGSLRGRVDFSAVAGSSNAVTFNNNPTANWHTTGTNTFSTGDSVFNNSGFFGTNGTTTLSFGGGSDALNNNVGATFFAAETPGASITTITGLETFNNAGTISLIDNESNDVLVANSAAYVSSVPARILLDATLAAGAAQSSCAGASADCVVFGAASGSGTTITINDLNAAGPGSLNPRGLALVQVAPGSPDNFTLAGSNVVNTPQGPAIRKGLVQYQLAFDATTGVLSLVGAPTNAMFEIANIIAGAENIWYATAEAWEERTAASRETMAAARNGALPILAQASTGAPTFWGRLAYAKDKRDRSQVSDLTGVSQTYDTSFDQNTSGMQLGVETLLRRSDNAWLVGGLAGYVRSQMHFADANKVDYSAWSVGLYASYLSGPVNVDALLKYDLVSVDLAFPGMTLPHTHDNNFGGKLTLGRTFVTEFAGPRINIEPMVTLSYMRSTSGRLVAPDATFDFGDAASVRAIAGGRLSTSFGLGPTSIQPFIFAGLGDDFAGQDNTTVVSGVTSPIVNTALGSFGVGSIGLNATGGLISGFVKANALYRPHAMSGAIWVGISLTP